MLSQLVKLNLCRIGLPTSTPVKCLYQGIFSICKRPRTPRALLVLRLETHLPLLFMTHLLPEPLRHRRWNGSVVLSCHCQGSWRCDKKTEADVFRGNVSGYRCQWETLVLWVVAEWHQLRTRKSSWGCCPFASVVEHKPGAAGHVPWAKTPPDQSQRSPSLAPVVLKDQGNVPAHAGHAALGACGRRTLLARSIFSILPLEGIVLLCTEPGAKGGWRAGCRVRDVFLLVYLLSKAPSHPLPLTSTLR